MPQGRAVGVVLLLGLAGCGPRTSAPVEGSPEWHVHRYIRAELLGGADLKEVEFLERYRSAKEMTLGGSGAGPPIRCAAGEALALRVRFKPGRPASEQQRDAIEETLSIHQAEDDRVLDLVFLMPRQGPVLVAMSPGLWKSIESDWVRDDSPSQ